MGGLPKKGAWIVCRFKGGGLGKREWGWCLWWGGSDTPMHKMKGNTANCTLKYTKRVRFFTSAVSVYFEKAAGILLSFHNTINEHRYSAIFAGDFGCSLICLHCTQQEWAKKKKKTRL